MGLWWTGFGMDKVGFADRVPFLAGRPRGEVGSVRAVTPQHKHLDSGGIEVVAGSMFRLFAFSLANHVLVHIQ